jgi:hypothetical protein
MGEKQNEPFQLSFNAPLKESGWWYTESNPGVQNGNSGLLQSGSQCTGT